MPSAPRATGTCQPSRPLGCRPSPFVRRVRARLSEWEGGKERKEPRANASTPDTSVYTGRDPKVRPQKGHYHGTYLLTATDDHVVLPRAAHKQASLPPGCPCEPSPASPAAGHQPAAARRAPCAPPAHDARTTGEGACTLHAPAATPRPRHLQPLARARTRAAGRGEGCRRLAAQLDDARARAHDRQETLQSHLTRSHTPALRNRNIKKVHGTVFSGTNKKPRRARHETLFLRNRATTHPERVRGAPTHSLLVPVVGAGLLDCSECLEVSPSASQ